MLKYSLRSKMATNTTIEVYLNKVDKFIEGHEKLDKILIDLEDRIKVKKSHIFLLGVTFVILGLGSGYAGQLLCNAIGFLYPSYASIKAIGKTINNVVIFFTTENAFFLLSYFFRVQPQRRRY